MCKKIFSTFILLTFICGFSFAATKNPYNDPNLIKFYQHQGYVNFLFLDSIQSHFQDSLRIISFNFFVFDSIQPANTDWDRIQSMQFAYDESTRKVYFIYPNGDLLFLDPNGSIAQGAGYAFGAEIVYFLATGNRFYGSFDDDFYNSLPVG